MTWITLSLYKRPSAQVKKYSRKNQEVIKKQSSHAPRLPLSPFSTPYSLLPLLSTSKSVLDLDWCDLDQEKEIKSKKAALLRRTTADLQKEF